MSESRMISSLGFVFLSLSLCTFFSRSSKFNSALLEAGKSVWVMNVFPTSGPNYLPLILDQGYVGVLHDWCEAFPTYPRTYDMVRAEGLLSLETNQ